MNILGTGRDEANPGNLQSMFGERKGARAMANNEAELLEVVKAARELSEEAHGAINSLLDHIEETDEFDRISVNRWSHAAQKLDEALANLDRKNP